MKGIRIAQRSIGEGQPCFVIAEAGVNHNGDLELAKKLVIAAAEARADAVKFQTFRAEQLVTASARKAAYQQVSTSAAESQFEMLRRLELSAAAHHELMTLCAECGLIFLSTPFEEESADLLEELDVPAFKISSGEITNLPFLDHVARKERPLILSTGMSTLDEVRLAVNAVRDAGNDQFVLLHCVSNYPAAPQSVNLRAMQTLGSAFRVPVGFSDHTMGMEIALAAVAMGACVVEKHLTLDCHLPGPDHRASIEPAEFAQLVAGIRKVEQALGSGEKTPSPDEADTAAVARKSVVAARAIAAGELLTENTLTVRRPGHGFPPAMRSSLVGRVARTAIPAGTVLTPEMLQ